MANKLEAFTKGCSSQVLASTPEPMRRRMASIGTTLVLGAVVLTGWGFLERVVVDRSETLVCLRQVNAGKVFFSGDARPCG